jgi:hypothetical protein
VTGSRASRAAIREATQDDADELARLRWQMTDEEGDASRNQGVGTPLLAAARELAERERLAELFVWPSDDTVSLYRRAGYAPSGEVHELELIPDL